MCSVANFMVLNRFWLDMRVVLLLSTARSSKSALLPPDGTKSKSSPPGPPSSSCGTSRSKTLIGSPVQTRQNPFRHSTICVGFIFSYDINADTSRRLHGLRKNAPMVIPQAPFAGGICFFFGICAKRRSLSRLRGFGTTLAPLFPQTVQPLTYGFWEWCANACARPCISGTFSQPAGNLNWQLTNTA
jgi:hypothetical protein